MTTLLFCGSLVILMIAAVEINQWAHDIGIVKPHTSNRWQKGIGFTLGFLAGILITALITL